MTSIGVPYTISGSNIYIIVRNKEQKVWNGSSFETYVSSNISSYAIDAIEQGASSQFYVVTIPVGLPSGDYTISFYEQLGTSPGEGDTVVDYVQNFPWNTSSNCEIGLTDFDTRLPTSLVSGRMDSDMEAISEDTSSANALERALEGVNIGSVDDSTFTSTTTQFETDLAESDDDHFNNQAIIWGEGSANAGLTFFITDSEGTVTNANNKVKLTVETMPNAPVNGDNFAIIGGK